MLAPMSDDVGDENKAVTRRFWDEVYSRHDLSKLSELLTDDFTLHVGAASLSDLDPEAMGEMWFGPFPDLAAEVLKQVAEDDIVADYLVFTGTHSGEPFHPGPFRARGLPPIPASGQRIEFTQTCMTRIEGGRMAGMWEDFDRVRFWMQLGVEFAGPG